MSLEVGSETLKPQAISSLFSMLCACGLRYEPSSSVPPAVLAACCKAPALRHGILTLFCMLHWVWCFVMAIEEPPCTTMTKATRNGHSHPLST